VTLALVEPAQEAYDALAFAYDALTADYCHDRWLEELEGLARDHGLAGRRLLDIACGTGKSFLPLRDRGYAVTACDLSEAMARQAAAKAPEARVIVADMRRLARIGAFDLVTCLDDALNYLLEEGDLLAAFQGMQANLAPRGVALWDVNTLRMYRTAFATDWITERDGIFIGWRGEASPEMEVGQIARATVHVFAREDAAWERSHSVHQQRHWSIDDVCRVAAAAGLRILAVRGQHRGAVLDDHADERLHTKVVFVAGRDDTPPTSAGGDHVKIGGP
jgi:SAM-dependent methyltransferase